MASTSICLTERVSALRRDSHGPRYPDGLYPRRAPLYTPNGSLSFVLGMLQLSSTYTRRPRCEAFLQACVARTSSLPSLHISRFPAAAVLWQYPVRGRKSIPTSSQRTKKCATQLHLHWCRLSRAPASGGTASAAMRATCRWLGYPRPAPSSSRSARHTPVRLGSTPRSKTSRRHSSAARSERTSTTIIASCFESARSDASVSPSLLALARSVARAVLCSDELCTWVTHSAAPGHAQSRACAPCGHLKPRLKPAAMALLVTCYGTLSSPTYAVPSLHNGCRCPVGRHRDLVSDAASCGTSARRSCRFLRPMKYTSSSRP